MIRLRSKAIEVEAVLYEGTTVTLKAVKHFVGEENYNIVRDEDSLPLYSTLEVWNQEERQWITIPVGHYVIKGVNGEFYPCSPSVIEQKYDVI